MIEQIDPIITEVIAELIEKNPDKKEMWQDYIDQRMWNARHRNVPSSKVEITECGTEVSERVKIISKWFEKWQGDIWDKVKIESPDLARDVMEAMDKIDDEFVRFTKSLTEWESVESKIIEYSLAWRNIVRQYPL